MKIGYLGGSFDPIHLGHLLLVESALDAGAVDRAGLLVAGSPPHKPGRAAASAADRTALALLAVAGHPRLFVDDRETRRPGPAYTVETLAEIAAESGPDVEIRFLVGADMLADVPNWREGPDLLRRYVFVSAARPGTDLTAALAAIRRAAGGDAADRAEAHVVPMPAIGISSTDVRARIAAGRSIRYLVPDAVREAIEARGLYRGS